MRVLWLVAVCTLQLGLLMITSTAADVEDNCIVKGIPASVRLTLIFQTFRRSTVPCRLFAAVVRDFVPFLYRYRGQSADFPNLQLQQVNVTCL